jgi:hypothetical protein
MRIRHDALVAAAEVITGVRRIAHELGGDLVTTIGNLVVAPNIVNAIPGRVTLSIDMRDPSDATLDRARARLEPIVREACEREGVRYELEHYWRVPYTPFDRGVVDTVERAARAAGAPSTWRRSGRPAWCSCPRTTDAATARRSSRRSTTSNTALGPCSSRPSTSPAERRLRKKARPRRWRPRIWTFLRSLQGWQQLADRSLFRRR